ncbi:hypothetical protein GALMADRAFT_55545 [Galerina marginata CBS 339.88]|uniref:Yeast cell wall synthesis Kre9/Knh1-like N-terminal domain-containing protein n=1 Tax=Galerina marginata (strain CBS 339.88) TaxID=685588 RepID=A0A067TVI2_GALM3|nr:hypothetical protein GALMADRAFT_55545 [Galerina marginata CBS 339.88]
MRAVAFLLAFVSSTFAYTVLSPNGAQGWTNQGGQLLTWQRVDTDRANFTVLLTNQNVTGFTPQILAALVDGTLGKATMNPPNPGWPTGSHFRVNLVQDATDLNSILAQSPEFDITPSTSTSNSTTAAGTTPVTGATPTDANTGGSPTDPITVPTSAAMSDFTVQTALLAFFSLMGIALA